MADIVEFFAGLVVGAGLCVGLVCVWLCSREGRAEDVCGLDVEGGCEVVEQRRDIVRIFSMI